MISVTRLTGIEVVINADLIETVESQNEDTVVTLVDGKRYVVSETTQQVVDRIRRFRADIIRRVDDPEITTTAQLRVLRRTSDD